jgi:hypothetical protein
MRAKESVRELLESKEAAAWFEYLAATRAAPPTRYVEVEAWAWGRLRRRLRAIDARRSELVPVA